MKNYALIVAAGRGSRFGSETPKQYMSLGNGTVLKMTVERFQKHPLISGVLVLIHPDDQNLYEDAITGLDILPCVLGGKTRQESVLNGLQALSSFSPDCVLIHDAARPFVSDQIITAVIKQIDKAHGVIPGVPVVDTLKYVDDGILKHTVDRTALWKAQTPQGFMYKDILTAHQSFKNEELTDDAALFERFGKMVRIVESDDENFKITTPDDYQRALRKIKMDSEIRVGNGFDVHKFVPGNFVTLCGVEIPYSMRLSGHSDADVAMHALTDALLGAIAAGDIGMHFPPSDPQWKGAASYIFLEKACSLLKEKKAKILNLDITIICEKPKIGPYRDEMQKKIAEICRIHPSRVSVKGTTTEKLGFTGREEGIAGQATACISIESHID